MAYAHRLEGERRIKLADFDPREVAGLKRAEGEKKTARFIEELIELQELLFSPHQQRWARAAIPQTRERSDQIVEIIGNGLEGARALGGLHCRLRGRAQPLQPKHAPWFVVPANKKWSRNLAVAETLRDALMPFKESWLNKVQELGRERKKAIDEYRGSRSHKRWTIDGEETWFCDERWSLSKGLYRTAG
jgi:hypothetical protein